MELNKITERIIGCAIEVHRYLGPGLLESIYESAICIEFNEKNLSHERQKILPVKYKHHKVGEFRIDLVVENKIVVELKSVERFDPVFEAQLFEFTPLNNSCIMPSDAVKSHYLKSNESDNEGLYLTGLICD